MKHDNKSSFFDTFDLLDPATRAKIEAAWKEEDFAPLDVICAQGSPPDAVYIVASGAVESITYSPDSKKSRLVALMARGDFFGDLSVFTRNPRLATIRAREATRVLRIDRDAFLRLLRQIPELGVFFSFNLARRLHATTTDAHHDVYAIDLSGNLQRFDLLTIVQAITGMGHTGELRLNNSANELLGSFFFRNGRVEHARFGHLLGLEAIWQGFVESASEGSFNFRSIAEPTTPFPAEYKIDIESTSLLLEGVGKRDVYQSLPITLRQMKGRLMRKVGTLEWKDPETLAVAQKIWDSIGNETRSFKEVWRSLNYSAMTFLAIIMEMGMSGQVEVLVAPEDLDESLRDLE